MSTKGRDRVSPLMAALESCVCPLTEAERQVARSLYRLLLAGGPTKAWALTREAGLPRSDVERVLRGLEARGLLLRARPDTTDRGRILGFGGLGTVPTDHEFITADGRAYAWCAWDALFLPGRIGAVAAVRSSCPETGAAIRLTVSPRAIRAARPAGLALSFLPPDLGTWCSEAREAQTRFCAGVRFFASEAVAERWTASSEDGLVLDLEEAFVLARRKNEIEFGLAAGAD